ncbi:MAG TPA: hypothetical protein DER09_14220 [Prolixibacteraceae bacterium]|nr:hypothetical protein [Prolixibacteraceae bacterium]
MRKGWVVEPVLFILTSWQNQPHSIFSQHFFVKRIYFLYLQLIDCLQAVFLNINQAFIGKKQE